MQLGGTANDRRSAHDVAFGYQPALDGVRAIAIVLVILFHLGYSWMPGGYLGVSVFFTLSGFLITSLLLDERSRRSAIRVRSFYARRVRRLLPASLVCIAGVSVLVSAGALVATRAQIVASLLQVANWQQLFSHQSYADLFRAPSAVAHFWSLAIEEQFYWVWPVAVAGITERAARRGRQSVLGPIVAAYLAFSASALLTARFLSPDAVYFASWSRFAEILAGAALAAALTRRTVPQRAVWLAPACGVAIIALSVFTPTAGGWAYAGGLPLFALLTVGLIVGLQPQSATRRTLSLAPVVWVGRISYELYLFHWPVFLLLTEDRTGLHDPWLSLVRVAVTVAISALVFHAIDQPVRTKRVLARTRPLFASAALGVFTLLVAAPLLIPATSSGHAPRTSLLAAKAMVPVATATPEAAGAAPQPPPPPRATTVALLGDSVADWLLRDAAYSYSRTDFSVINGAHEACDGAVDMPVARDRHGKRLYPPSDCQTWPQSYPTVVADPAHPVDIAVLVIGQAPYFDRLIDGQWQGPCQSIDWYTSDVTQRIAYLRAHVGEVVLALPSWSGSRVTYSVPNDHRQRMGCIRDALQTLAAATNVPIVDLATLLCPDGPGGSCAPYTSDDGVHVNPPDAPLVLNWLLDQLPTPGKGAPVR